MEGFPATQDLVLDAADGYRLAATRVRTVEPPVAAVVIAPAMGVPRQLYARLAAYWATRGLATLTFDYRGIGGSAPAKLRGFGARLRDWGELDLSAAVNFLAAAHPGVPLLLHGHSVGGQLLGILPEPNRVKAALLVASQSGYWRHWPGLGQAPMFALWHVALPLVGRALGRIPMKRLGQGEDLPEHVARDWARFGRHPDYLKSYARTVGGRGFAHFTGPVRSYAFSDDSFAPPATVSALARQFQGTLPEVKVVTPGDFGEKAIGHFGAYKARFQQALWAQWAEWLLAQAGAAAASQR